MNVMNAKLVLSVLLACGCSVSASASEDAADRSLLKQCESAKGEVKEECRDVAKEMIRNDASSQERNGTSSQEVTHSSPAMNPPADKQREAAKKKPKAEEKKDAAPQKPANPDPAK